MSSGETGPGVRGDRLRADCARCVGLCCVGLAFGRSADFPVDKAPGVPCPQLSADGCACTVHDRLRDLGYRGCTVFDCQGAGPQTLHVVYGGRNWRDDPELATDQFAVFHVEVRLHELLWYLAEVGRRAEAVPLPSALKEEADRLWAELDRLSAGSPMQVLRVDLAAVRDRVEPLLTRASAALRADRPSVDRSRAELSGADLRTDDLRAASLRGARLIRADLRGVDLTRTDLLGADLRDADLRGADLSDALFVTAQQVAAAVGDRATRIPAVLDRPGHWG